MPVFLPDASGMVAAVCAWRERHRGDVTRLAFDGEDFKPFGDRGLAVVVPVR